MLWPQASDHLLGFAYHWNTLLKKRSDSGGVSSGGLLFSLFPLQIAEDFALVPPR
jgi:hypothetical protein